jgi:subtilisin family serine protease
LLEQLGVKPWHAAGYLGRGVKVAVLDSGFAGYRAHLGKALPDRVATKSFRFDGDLEARPSQHGILCGEIIHTLAPEAELLFANWEPERSGQFLEALQWAREQGARVVSCSVIMPSWSDGEGHGPAHEALTRLLGPGEDRTDGLCFASAGNTAQRHWSGPFQDGGDGRHEWARGMTGNAVTPWGSERVSVELCSPAGASYELAVLDVTVNREVGRARTPARGERCCAVVAFNPLSGHSYRAGVRLAGGKSGAFHLVVLGGWLEHTTSHGSIPFPGDGPEVIAVGAVDQDGRRWAYSSCGPNSSRPKPDFVATVPFPSSWRAQPFSGTSAAAPQAAALAALLWSRHPGWSADQMREALHSAARRLSGRDHDDETGYGRIHLPPLARTDRP